MRYYIVCLPRYLDLRPYVVTEVIAESEHEARMRGLAGLRALVLTDEDLLYEPWGRRAYEDWRLGDDSQFEEDTRRGMAEPGAEDEAAGRWWTRPILRVVP
jgi:hypothetical protein